MSIFASGIKKNPFALKDEQTDPVPMQVPSGSSRTIRYSLQQLQLMYDSGHPEPLEDVVIAFKGIIDKDPDDPYSFFYIGGLHGAPLQLREEEEERKYWGGWCNHANVLFPTWHRVYCRYIEKALQSVVPGVGLPFLDETGEDAYYGGIPPILTDRQIKIKGKMIDNPLRSFVLPETLPDNYGPSNHLYRKEKGYETVRFPFSGLVGDEKSKRRTKRWNSQFTDEEATEMLNDNFKKWLRVIDDDDDETPMDGVQYQYINCLTAPNYTVFSNTASVATYNESHPGHQYSLEGPHNNIHLSIGGFTEITESIFKKKSERVLAGPNGDMGNNNTAGLDPIFFFHHCFVDYVFWQWQRRNGFTDSFDIEAGYMGTNTSDTNENAQGPAVGQNFNENLSMESPLLPFKNRDGDYITSKNSVNIFNLGYDFGPGSLDMLSIPNNPYSTIRLDKRKKLQITKITRKKFKGSFVIYAFAKFPSGENILIGQYVIFSRYDIEFCANCQKHMDINAMIPINQKVADKILDGLDLKPEVTINLKYQTEDADSNKVISESGVDEFSFQIKE